MSYFQKSKKGNTGSHFLYKFSSWIFDLKQFLGPTKGEPTSCQFLNGTDYTWNPLVTAIPGVRKWNRKRPQSSQWLKNDSNKGKHWLVFFVYFFFNESFIWSSFLGQELTHEMALVQSMFYRKQIPKRESIDSFFLYKFSSWIFDLKQFLGPTKGGAHKLPIFEGYQLYMEPTGHCN